MYRKTIVNSLNITCKTRVEMRDWVDCFATNTRLQMQSMEWHNECSQSQNIVPLLLLFICRYLFMGLIWHWQCAICFQKCCTNINSSSFVITIRSVIVVINVSSRVLSECKLPLRWLWVRSACIHYLRPLEDHWLAVIINTFTWQPRGIEITKTKSQWNIIKEEIIVILGFAGQAGVEVINV